MKEMIGSEPESEPSSTPKLPLFSILPMQSPEPSGMVTPPLQTSASVPFRWEEEPGKPRPCTVLIALPDPNHSRTGPKTLELPPRLLITLEPKITKTPSPTTVLDGPDKPKFSSFRFSREREESFDSFENRVGSPEGGQFGNFTVGKRGGGGHGSKGRRFLGSWGQRTLKVLRGGKKENLGGSFVFSDSMDVVSCGVGGGGGGDESGGSRSSRVKMSNLTRNGSFSSLSQPRFHFWEAIHEGFKQVYPWNRKSKKERLTI